MPELPEVEFARRCLERWLGGEVLARVEAEPVRTFRGTTPAAFEKLKGHRVETVGRRGKWLIVRCDRGLGFVGHLGMTGKLVLQRPGEEEVRWSRARFHRRDKAIVHFQDTRMFGRLVAGNVDALVESEGIDALGPDAWESPPTIDALFERTQRSKRSIKDLLMDQSILAGIGNIQATEALHHARLHPATPAPQLDRDAVKRVRAGVHWSLARTLKLNEGDEMISYVEEPGTENPFTVYGREGEPCPRCGAPLDALTIAGRTSVFCPVCQPRPGTRRVKSVRRSR